MNFRTTFWIALTILSLGCSDAQAKMTVAFGQWEPYTGSLVATITLTTTNQGEFTFALDKYHPESTQADFVDFTGQTLDFDLLFWHRDRSGRG